MFGWFENNWYRERREAQFHEGNRSGKEKSMASELTRETRNKHNVSALNLVMGCHGCKEGVFGEFSKQNVQGSSESVSTS